MRLILARLAALLVAATLPYDEGDLFASGSGRRRARSLSLAGAR